MKLRKNGSAVENDSTSEVEEFEKTYFLTKISPKLSGRGKEAQL